MQYLNKIVILILLLVHNGTYGKNTYDFNKWYKQLMSNPELQQLYQWQDQRNSSKVLPFLQHRKPIYRQTAAMALAAIKDTTSQTQLLDALKIERETAVKYAMIYAIGQIGQTDSQKPLLAFFKTQKSKEIQNILLESLGKCVSSLDEYETLLNFIQPKQYTHYLYGLYYAATKGIISEKFDIAPFAAHSNTLTRILATNYCYRYRNKLLIANNQTILAELLMYDPEPEVRANSAMALSALPNQTEQLLAALATETNDLVTVAIIKAFIHLADPKAGAQVFEKLKTTVNPNVQLIAAQYLHQTNPHVYTRALELPNLCLAAQYEFWQSGVEAFDNKLINWLKNKAYTTSNLYERGLCLRALGYHLDEFGYLQAELNREKTGMVATFTFEAILNILDNNIKKIQNNNNIYSLYGSLLRNTIESGDVGLACLAAGALANKQYKFDLYFKDIGFLETALQQYALPTNFEAYIEISKTIAQLKNQPIPTNLRPAYNNAISWDLLENLGKKATATITTSGNKEIELQLMPQIAPATVANFVRLADLGYYNGKIFHRLVPNFVLQGGCPRGDGWGSTPSSIRTEASPLHFIPGSVGMASAGPDTESCQFFINQFTTPHLDGKYTIFAQVIAGMENLYQIAPGDSIISIRINRNI
ncbi:MAG: peptidylprolyl isomerase [Chitinophagales bacterium]|mgnify:CR=1 FL=1|jgi:cyclophilin family peptidyl-prolyl cis-trans isomerase|nr:peptidylprolyl isomerase [Chitinophagales bacterium]MCC7055844.1 peptidylprolyl isomerase [Chitinophagales bacterium]MDA0199575.1 peptidylprolyl isomerase [Bacteroidota bacterium]